MKAMKIESPIFELSPLWKSSFPAACAGVLVMHNAANPARHTVLDEQKTALEERLRREWSSQGREALAQHPILQAYEAYYRRFKKTYHVQLQVESIAFKGKSIPGVAALVEAMFMAEVDNMLLTAGHDLDALQLPVLLDVARGDESYTLLRGQEQTLKPGDMFMRDRLGAISSILYGPDSRTQITAGTRNVMFTAYAPEGVPPEAVHRHLGDIEQIVRLVAPQARTELLEVFDGR